MTVKLDVIQIVIQGVLHMTKQQQQKLDKVNKALSLFEEGKTLKEASDIVGYSRPDKLKRALKELGYVYDDIKGIWCNTECDTECNTMPKEPCNTQRITRSITPIAQPKPQKLSIHSEHLELFNDLIEERETLKNMLIWYKKHIDTAGTDILLIELPESENQLVTVRTNKAVWEEFGKFAEENKAFSKGDLVAQALLDFVKRNKA